MDQPVKTRISAEEYFQLPEHEKDLIQLIDGKVVIGTTPPIKHQDILGNVLMILHAAKERRGGHIYIYRTEVYFSDYYVLQPDMVYLMPSTRCEIGEERIVGAPELVVEVLSPSTAKYDRDEKYHAYEAHGVHEYWIVDPLHEVVEVYALEDDTFDLQGAYAPDDTFDSSVLGETVTVKEIFGAQ